MDAVHHFLPLSFLLHWVGELVPFVTQSSCRLLALLAYRRTSPRCRPLLIRELVFFEVVNLGFGLRVQIILHQLSYQDSRSLIRFQFCNETCLIDKINHPDHKCAFFQNPTL